MSSFGIVEIVALICIVVAVMITISDVREKRCRWKRILELRKEIKK